MVHLYTQISHNKQIDRHQLCIQLIFQSSVGFGPKLQNKQNPIKFIQILLPIHANEVPSSTRVKLQRIWIDHVTS